MKLLLTAMLSLSFLSCQDLYEEKNPYTYYKKDQAYFNPIVNQIPLPNSVDRTKLKLVRNDAYPIEIALFNDGQFHYYLENLGDGNGTWKYEDGHISLYAERKRFVMEMDIHSVNEKGDEIIVYFHDRIGANFLPLEKQLRF